MLAQPIFLPYNCPVLFKIDVSSGTGLRPTERDESLALWDFHDLLFHARSTEGRHANLVGGLYPYVGVIAPRPAVRSSWPGKKIELYMSFSRSSMSSTFPVESLTIPMLLAPSPVHFYQDQR